MKGIIRIMGVALLITAMAVPAFAQRGMGREGKGMRGPMRGEFLRGDLTDEQVTQLQELRDKYLDETSGIKDEIAKKAIDLRAVLNEEEPDAKKAKAIQKDISDLEAKLDQARIDHIIEAKKINPDCPLYGRGMMGGMRGFGPGPFGY